MDLVTIEKATRLLLCQQMLIIIMYDLLQLYTPICVTLARA